MSTSTSLVAYHGRMRTVPGKSHFVGERSQEIVCPAGTSLFWSSASSRYYTAATVRALKTQFNAQIVRAAMTAWSGWSDGYTTQPDKYLAHAITVADAAIAEGIYVILDWHCEGDNTPYLQHAKTFFRTVAQKYSGVPNVIYEIWNEPKDQTWNDKIRPYCVDVIAEIRRHDPTNLILCGTQTWSQKVEDAARNPIPDVNVAYVLHFYSNLHGPWLYQNKHTLGVPVFVSEWGTPGAHANTQGFVDWLARNNVPHISWAANNKAEPLSYFVPSSTAVGPWALDRDLTPTGQIFLALLRDWKGNQVPTAPRPQPTPAPPPSPSTGGWSVRLAASAVRQTAPGVQRTADALIGFKTKAWATWDVTFPTTPGRVEIACTIRAPQGGKLRFDYAAGKTVLAVVDLPVCSTWTTVRATVANPGQAVRLGLFAVQGTWDVQFIALQTAGGPASAGSV